MNHKAIYALYTNVVSIDDKAGAFDAQRNQVTIDMSAVNAWIDPEAYKNKRAKEYPSIIDYIDGVVKSDQAQINKYIADCQAVKIKHPKG